MNQLFQVGPVQVRYQSGALRTLTLHGTEVLRAIYIAVRDQYWQTASLTISDEELTQTADSFRLSYAWATDDLGLHLAGTVVFTGTADGVISLEFFAESLAEQAINRVGICVLHPLAGVTGQPYRVTSPLGQTTEGHFSHHISPHQPVFDIQTLAWQPAGGPALQLVFGGDVFEMEDQRNWTDASFKTYSTVPGRPLPYTLRPHEAIRQTVAFGPVAPGTWLAPLPVPHPVVAPAPAGAAPLQLGLGQHAGGVPLLPTQTDQLRALPLTHLRADVLLTTPDWPARLTNALADARALGIALELALFFGENPRAEFQLVQHHIINVPVRIHSVLLFDTATLRTSDPLLAELLPILRAEWPGTLVGGGTDTAFADLNRHPFAYHLVDFVVYPANPQVHATDDLTITENLNGLLPTVQTARWLSGGKPVHISPLTFAPRYPPVTESIGQRLAPVADARLDTPFGHEWLRQSLAALTAAGVASVTLGEAHGPRAVPVSALTRL